MAPIKISYVVSFSSQDPKYPAENLLSEDGIQPWLGCPKKHSKHLSVELQLERASPIGYVDIGTSLSPTPVQEPGLCPTMGSAALNPHAPQQAEVVVVLGRWSGPCLIHPSCCSPQRISRS
uniref:DNA-repair protein Xrcc1 N-terminal domain-containing protein n=1 Tax=Catharus ustulatus TaxID=91951 RepID=A0A8C3U238_CATUS